MNDGGPPTPRQTSSRVRALSMGVASRALARRLRELAASPDARPGRRDIQMLAVARSLFEVGGKFDCWHDPPPGREARTDIFDRAKDKADFDALVKAARTLGAEI